MLAFIKKSVLKQKQAAIKKRFPSVNIVLHPDMPQPSVNKMLELSRVVNMVNSLEPEVSALSDEQLRKKTQGFKEIIAKKHNEYSQKLQELQEAMPTVAIPEEKEKIKERLKLTRNKVFEDVLPEVFRRHQSVP